MAKVLRKYSEWICRYFDPDSTPAKDCGHYWEVEQRADEPVECPKCKSDEIERMGSVTVVKCHCGREVHCSGFTTTCDCGADYNWSGAHLAPRCQWGEETGETEADILGPDDPTRDYPGAIN